MILSKKLLSSKEILHDIYNIVEAQIIPDQCWLPWAERKLVPKDPGIYIISKNDEIIYIGETSNIYERLTHHKNGNGSALKDKIQDYTNCNPDKYLQDCKIKFLPITLGRIEIERYLINKYNPVFNNYKLRKRYKRVKTLVLS